MGGSNSQSSLTVLRGLMYVSKNLDEDVHGMALYATTHMKKVSNPNLESTKYMNQGTHVSCNPNTGLGRSSIGLFRTPIIGRVHRTGESDAFASSSL